MLDNKISKLNGKIKYKIKNNKTLTNAEINELQNKIKDITAQRDSINSELRHAVNVIKKQKKKRKKEKRELEELKKEADKFLIIQTKK